MFDRCVLINLKRRRDRLVNFRRQQIEIGWPLPAVEVYEAIDGNLVGVPEHYTAGGGAWGCLRSHVSILERALMDELSSILILEDDVCWDEVASLQAFLRDVPQDWDMLMLGGQHMESTLPVSSSVVRCSNCQRTHAYAIRGGALKDLLGLWYRCDTHIDHWMGPWQKHWKVYAPDPFVFGQAGGRSDISGSLNPIKFWKPPASQPIVWLSCPEHIARSLRGWGLHLGYDREAEIDRGLQRIVTSIERKKLLKEWVDMILWEVASDTSKIACLFHPDIVADELRAVHDDVVEITGESEAECLAKLQARFSLKRNYASSHLVLLRTPKHVIDSMSGLHRGYYLDEMGRDQGIKEIESMSGIERSSRLRDWVSQVGGEAERIGAIPVVWSDSITREEVQAVTAREVIVVEAMSTSDACTRLSSALNRSNNPDEVSVSSPVA